MSGYIGVSNKARTIKNLYIGVNGIARKVSSAYVGINGTARKWYSSDPNTRYEDKSLGTWNTATQVNTFFNTYTYENNWTGLSLGNYVTINDGIYNINWVIAGFNCESRADGGTTGGIVFIPRYTNLATNVWATYSTYTTTPYKNSAIHTLINGTIKTNLSTILGSHIVQRNVTLGSACSGTSPREWTTSATTNTTAYLTLMSWGQLSGTFGSHNNSYDDGEANYKLPLFNFISLSTYANGSSFWLRNVYGKNGSSFNSWRVYTYGAVGNTNVDFSTGVRPLMYLVGDPVPQPSTEYEDKSLGTWSTATQVNTFFNTYTYKTGWAGLKIGNYVTIKDGTYDMDWVIAGFNCETASGGGIVFIPRYVNLGTYNWDGSGTAATSYKDSDIHYYINNTVKNNLSTILGSHIVQRNVTLGSACTGTDPRDWTTSATTNTTAYLTLMSAGQLTGTSFGSCTNSMDDGEANYKLPLFNFITTKTYANSSTFWLRNVYGRYSSRFRAWNCYSNDGSISSGVVSYDAGVRPLIYLR